MVCNASTYAVLKARIPVIPRSVMLAELEDVQYLLCGMGDGQFISYVLAVGGTAIASSV